MRDVSTEPLDRLTITNSITDTITDANSIIIDTNTIISISIMTNNSWQRRRDGQMLRPIHELRIWISEGSTQAYISSKGWNSQSQQILVWRILVCELASNP